MAEALFYALGLAALYGGANAVARGSPVTCVLHLALTLFALSGIYLLLGFPLLAGVNLLVYAGAILVLVLFVVLLLDLRERERVRADLRARLGPLLGLVLLLELLAIAASAGGSEGAPGGVLGTPQATGRMLFGRYLLPFEAAGLLLLAAVVAVLVLARRAPRPPSLSEPVPAAFREAGFPEGRA